MLNEDVGVRRAIVLAAGQGRRLFPISELMPKALVQVAGRAIIVRLVDELLKCGIREIIVVTGFMESSIRKALAVYSDSTQCQFVFNENFEGANNVRSLWLARGYFDEDFLLLESDVVFQEGLLAELCALPCGTDAAVVSPLTLAMEGACVRLDGVPPSITPPRPRQHYGPDSASLYKTVNFYRISAKTAQQQIAPRLSALINEKRDQVYYEEAIAEAISDGEARFLPVLWSTEDWYEIDNVNDLGLADYQFAEPEERHARLGSEHGGYWRYPVTDHCLLYNCHYPPAAVFDHLRSRLEPLAKNYPAAQGAIGRFVGGYFGLPQEWTVVGNGVSELIRALGLLCEGRLLLPSPSFDEYETLVPKEKLIRFPLRREEGFRLSVKSVVETAIFERVSLVVIVAPNNPTGVDLSGDDLRHLVEGLSGSGIRVLLDDSFADFSEANRGRTCVSDLLARYDRLVVVRSLGKSHGLGGLRLGLIASADRDLIDSVRQLIPIWNINGFAEEYARIMGAFRNEYLQSCVTVRQETRQLVAQIDRLPGLLVYPSDANFVFIEIEKGLSTATALTARLLDEHGMFIKDCSTKRMNDAGQFVRIASRTAWENSRLVKSLESTLDGFRSA